MRQLLVIQNWSSVTITTVISHNYEKKILNNEKYNFQNFVNKNFLIYL